MVGWGRCGPVYVRRGAGGSATRGVCRAQSQKSIATLSGVGGLGRPGAARADIFDLAAAPDGRVDGFSLVADFEIEAAGAAAVADLGDRFTR